MQAGAKVAVRAMSALVAVSMALAVIGEIPAAAADGEAPSVRRAVPIPAQPVKKAVAEAARHAAEHGVKAYVSVVDRHTGLGVAQTPDAGEPVQSESVIKLLIAAYYPVTNGGYLRTPPALRSRLAYMLQYSDDATATALFKPAAIPYIARRYGLQSTSNAPGRVGRWGAALVSATDMTRFMARAAADPMVGPWLLPVMARTAPYGSDGFDQQFGLESITGEHGSKQGWGNDTASGPRLNAIHSVGYTSRYFVAILQLASRPPTVLKSTSTYAAKLVNAAIMIPPRDGLFVRYAGSTYRIAGGAPVRVVSWATVGGVRPVAVIGEAVWARLAVFPADGTFVRAGDVTYRIAGGAPIRVASWASVGGVQPVTVIDPAAVANAGSGGAWDHLRSAA